MGQALDLEQELLDLEARQRRLDYELAEAQRQQRFGADPEEARRAKEQEHVLLRDLDRLMTRIRAVEGKLLQVRRLGRH
jgi:predicted  nucleic acid-binding Zn-ribbon protein